MTGRGLLAALRRHPLPVLAAVLTAVLTATALVPRATAAPSFLAVIAATYWTSRHAGPWGAAAGLTASGLAVSAGTWLSAPAQGLRASAISFMVVALVAVPAAAGGAVRARASLARQLHLAAARLRTARAARISAAVSGERRRISAELDRVMLRGLDEMRRYGAAADRAQVAELEQAARATLAEMRVLLTRFRSEKAPGAPAAAGAAVTASLPELRQQVMNALSSADAAGTGSPGTAEGSGPSASAVRSWSLPARRHIDMALTVVAVVLAVWIAVIQAWPAALLGVAIMFPVAMLRRAPLPAAVVAMAATVGFSAAARPPDPLAGPVPVAVMVLVPLVAAAAASAARSVPVLAGCLAVIVAAVAVDPAKGASLSEIAGAAVFGVASWAIGAAVRRGGRMLAEVAETMARARDEEAAVAREAAAGERLRIARELHDAAGHALTAVVMQATAARRVWDSDPVLAARHVAVLRETVTRSAEELHALGVTLALGTDAIPRSGTGALRALAEAAAGRGLPVSFHGEGTEAPLPAAAAQAAYRIVQEAITNAARHAPGGRVRVTVRHDRDGVRLEITNEPRDWPSEQYYGGSVERGGGHGLRGMRERAQACGGTVEAGPAADGGFTVRSWLPARPVTVAP